MEPTQSNKRMIALRELYKTQITEIQIAISEAKANTSYIGVEKLLKLKHDVQQQLTEIEAVLDDSEQDDRSYDEYMLDVVDMVGQLPIGIVKRLSDACKERMR